jgi:hypothetical protein
MKKLIEFGNFKPETVPPVSSVQHELTNPDNYLSIMNCDVSIILEKYTILLFKYMLFLFEKIKITKKKLTYFRYIFERGVDTITRVFSGLIEYTKNIDLAFHHGQKAFYFYIEFIEQISDAQNSFLQLSSRDAVMFVYKRTIFEVNKEMVKSSNAIIVNNVHLQTLAIFCNICKNCAMRFIQSDDLCEPLHLNKFVVSFNSIAMDIKKMNINDIQLVTLGMCELASNGKHNPIDAYLFELSSLVNKIASDLKL